MNEKNKRKEIEHTKTKKISKNEALLHAPPVADNDTLTSQGSSRETSQEGNDLSHVFNGSELAIDSVLEHDFLDHILLRDAKLGRLFRDLLGHQRREHETRAHNIGLDLSSAFLGHSTAQTNDTVFGSNVRSLVTWHRSID